MTASPTESVLDHLHDDGPWVDCWQCGGEGVTYDCFDGFCEDAESGCDDCERRCDICKGKGGWPSSPAHGPKETGG